MKTAYMPLTAQYRPQTFADVAGQELVTRILSRASVEDRIAPAYLLSGTRGVGKTTIARIFAKALNCVNAPTAEPCNKCEHCLKITAGASIDVIEIDGASNRGIDDARRLKESIGYAAMESRYKVFIIDEAHMLTKDAFNALLKTLEEPPARVTFILATTEPHKFPITIISRCQHFIFKRLSEQGITQHLTKILEKEQVAFQPGALNLISKRANGSVRDSMSLLGQVLALNNQEITEEGTRNLLGLIGHDLFVQIIQAIAKGKTTDICKFVQTLLNAGVDIGFFMRELASSWRTLFILKQAGDSAWEVLDVPQEEHAEWEQLAASLSLPHIHACWQMTIESQRKVLTNLEPAMALELMLLNLSLLPQLLSLEELSRGAGVKKNSAKQLTATVTEQKKKLTLPENTDTAEFALSISVPSVSVSSPTPSPVPDYSNQYPTPDAYMEPAHMQEEYNYIPPVPEYMSEIPHSAAPHNTAVQTKPAQTESVQTKPANPAAFHANRSPKEQWNSFIEASKANSNTATLTSILNAAAHTLGSTELQISPQYQTQANLLRLPKNTHLLTALVKEQFGSHVVLTITEPTEKIASPQEIRQELEKHPAIQLLNNTFNAQILSCMAKSPHQK